MSAMLLMREGPGDGLLARERIDIALMGLALDEPVTVAFVDDGVLQLLPQSEDGHGHSLLKVIRSLPLYDVTDILVEQESLRERRVAEVDPIAKPISRKRLRRLIRRQARLL